MLVNLKTVLDKARNGKRAIGAFNIYNMETVQAVFEAAQKKDSPVILAFGEGYFSHAEVEVIATMVRKMCSGSAVPVVLHLDHAKKKESIIRAIRCGFTSVMYDGSALSLRDNINNTVDIVQIAHSVDVSVEGELGYMNSEDGGTCSIEPEYRKGYTTPEEAESFVAGTGVDALAVSIGNAHGLYKALPQLDFERLDRINKTVDVPLVLHGSSGIPDEMLKTAISLGICKININTEISAAAVRHIRNFLEQNRDESLRFDRVMAEAGKGMTAAIEKYMDIFEKA